MKVVFKSGANLSTLLTNKNKSKLPDHSHPGVYKITCKKHPENPYIGETKLQIRTRNEIHKGYVMKEQWDQSGVASHSILCKEVEWDAIETLKVEKTTHWTTWRQATRGPARRSLMRTYVHGGPATGRARSERRGGENWF